MAEKICVNCEGDIDLQEPFLMVDDKYLCDSHCLGDFLQTHGLAALKQGAE